ncbi:MAG TPA: FAD-dependent oxidoreductase, partial [Burkholderiaceae bacterium]|nr:FAD-dependent oxidoreductase [Burkholderiaceae bacterium]
MNARRALVLAAIVAALAAFVALDLGDALSLGALKARQAELQAAVAARPLASAAAYLGAYVLATALSLPGAATALTLLGGALFGFWAGLVLASFASSAGATLAFLASRYLFRDAVRARFGERLAAIDEGVRRDGAFYLFSLRLIPVFPFFLVNLVMGLTPIRTRVYHVASQLGMLAGTAVYVNAGTELARVESASGLLSPALIASFVLLGLFPLVAKKAVDAIAARRVYRGWRRPARFDRNMVVIGAGSGGLVTAYIAAAVKASVTLVERHRMGGDCLNTGCVPSKALLRSARLLAQARRAPELGIRAVHVEFDFAQVMERVARVVREIEPHDSVERYAALGVEVLEGEATIRSPWEVEVRLHDGTTRTLAARSIVVATGARPAVPPIPGLRELGCLTSDTVWGLRVLPRRLLVLGGGPIGCELALAFARFGSRVVLVEQAPRLLSREDDEVSAFVEARFREEGIDLRLGSRALRVEPEGDARTLVASRDGVETRIPFDEVLCALGRTPVTAGFGLEALGVPLAPGGTIEVDDRLRTRYPNVYAVGDVAGPYQFTHTASHMAWFAAVNALFGRLRRFRVDWRVVPWCTFLDPEVARVGLNEREARERGVPYEVVRYGVEDLDRAIADGAARGFVKVLTRPGS